jgi:hypothetical protein
MPFTYDTTDSITVSGISPVWDEGVEEHFDRSTAWARRTMRCRWDQRAALVTALRGGAGLIGNVTIYNPAQQYPDYGGLYIDAVDIEGVPANGLDIAPSGVVAYKYARLRALYTSLGFIDGVDKGFLSLDYGTEIIKLPDGAVSVSGGGVRLAQSPTKRVPCQTLVYMRRSLATLPTAAILAASAAPLNSASFFGGVAGSVLFEGGRSSTRLTTSGATNWDLELRFSHRDNPRWNQAHDSNGVIQDVTLASGTPLYSSSDLNSLIA